MTPLDRGLRRLVPRGLLGRSLLIILVPLLLLQAIALQVFYGSHLDVISRRLAAGVAGDIAMVVGLLEREAEEQDRTWISAKLPGGLICRLLMKLARSLQQLVGVQPPCLYCRSRKIWRRPCRNVCACPLMRIGKAIRAA